MTAMRAAQDYRLCERCSLRQGIGVSTAVSAEGCHICGGLMGRLEDEAEAVARTVERYQFKSFAVGVTMPEGVQEREDELRADLKLRGSETVRTQAARLIAERVARVLGKKIDRSRPDLTLVVDVATGKAAVSSKSLFYYCRYSKPAGVSQKRELCGNCSGQGCEKCRKTGLEAGPSVEGSLRQKFSGICGSENMKFTWIGSEDKDSKVYPPGRPFVVELKNPVRRALPGKFNMRTGRGLLSFSRGRVLPSKPTSLPSFRFRTLITAEARTAIDRERLAQFSRSFRRATVRFERPHERPTSKVVYLARAKIRGKTLRIEAVLDGGLPVKRFVSGELVSPSVSEVLKTEVRCRTFDIREVKETGEFGFGKITRV